MKTMETQITKGIKICVQPQYEPQHSNPKEHRYLYSYEITIENLSEFTVQLLRRHWVIVDSNGRKKNVEGNGVIGQQPILRPGQIHEYNSWCPLGTGLGKMSGYYTMKRLEDDLIFQVQIPAFDLTAPFKLN